MPPSPEAHGALRVAIVGAGFSGAMVAAQLLRAAARAPAGARPVHVALVAGATRVGRGTAYSTACDAHLLNVSAGRMSALPDEPEHFLRWARAQDASIETGTFVPRALYGAYIEHALLEAETEARERRPGCAVLERYASQATAIDPAGDGDAGPPCAARVRLADGRTLHADRVVLAFGNFAPADPLTDASDACRRTPRYVRDPWAPGALDAVGASDAVLLLGTGLTMIDVVLALASRAHRGALVAVSRRGMLPARHADAPYAPRALETDAQPLERTTRALLRRVLRHVHDAEAAGANWRAAIDGLRPITAAAWRGLDLRERRRFLRHVRPYWDACRHRAPPRTFDAIQREIARGRLRVMAGRLAGVRDADGAGVQVDVVPRGGASAQAFEVGWVVNCTGPELDIGRVEDPLIRGLVAAGHARPDPLRLGMDVSDDGVALGRDGRPVPWLFAAGPMRRPNLWEATAVPELREQAAALARTLLVAD
jgi:uncharacterized NAD(P)/FAD-binding protein YdhS